jgi:multiple sugar transport system substrate-binding protein
LGEHPFCANCGQTFSPDASVVPPPVQSNCLRCGAPLYPGYSQCTYCGLDNATGRVMGKPMDASRASTLIVGGALALIAILVLSLAFVAVVLRPHDDSGAAPAVTFGPVPAPTWQETPIAETNTPTVPPASKTIRWFVGVGTGYLDTQVQAEKAFVSKYNATNADGVTLVLEVVPYETSRTTLKTEIASGNAPDIIGPAGLQAIGDLQGLLLDLNSQIARNYFDMTSYDPAVVRGLQSGSAQFGIPYDVYPNCIWYNKDLFAAAGLPSLPTKVGDQYQGTTWDWDALTRVAAQLTVDQSGNKSTSAAFDKTRIKTYGMDFEWASARSMAAAFGGGSFVGSDGKTAQIPQVWADAYSWYYNAIWTQHIAPDATSATSTYLGDNGAMASGHLAMTSIGSWGLDLVGNATSNPAVKHWDIGVMPSWKGTTSAPLEEDTFVISKASRNPEAAFKAMIAIEADKTLMETYGGMPARTIDQASFFARQDATLAPTFPGNQVTWSVLAEMEKYPPVPSHESYMPNFTKSQTDANTFLTRLQTTAGLDVNAELYKLKQTLQVDFDAAATTFPPA